MLSVRDKNKMYIMLVGKSVPKVRILCLKMHVQAELKSWLMDVDTINSN